MRLLITRAEPDASELAAKLTDLGHEVLLQPLIHVQFFDCPKIGFQNYQALVFTSRNALRFLQNSSALNKAIHLPVFCVGPASAKMAQEMGFQIIFEGPGTAEQLLDTIKNKIDPAKGAILHLAGQDLAFDLTEPLKNDGILLDKQIVYQTEDAKDLGPGTKNALQKNQLDGVILLSPKTARIWVNVIQNNGLLTEALQLTAFCLSDKIAKELEKLNFNGKYVKTCIAQRPTLEDLLAVITLQEI